MTVPYITENDGLVRCLCVGCGAELWKTERLRDGSTVTVTNAAYGDLYLAMIDRTGGLSEHSHPTCPACADSAIHDRVNLDHWWDAIVLHWFIEERVRGAGPDAAYDAARRLEGNRRPVRATRYVPYDARA